MTHQIKEKKLITLKKGVKGCKRCKLWRSRNCAVFGEGDANTEIMIIAEAPGFNEDRIGRPFCGRAGRFLDELLKIANLKREKNFITNVIKCRPPKNRAPKKEEVEACRPWLEKQIEILKPKLIITLGSPALSWFSPNLKISRVHGRFRKISLLFQNSKLKIKFFPTYHPAAAFRRGSLRKILKKDFRKIKKITKRLI